MLGHEFHNTFFFTVVNVPDYVREGRFDRFLVRPQDTLFQVLTVPSQIFFDGLALALIYFVIATWYSGVQVDLAFIVFVPFVVLGGALIDLGISLAVATVAFWYVRVDTLRWVVMSLEQEFTRYPISIYTRSVRVILAFVFPFAFMNYFPATFLLHKAETGLSLSPQIGLLTPLIGAAWLAVSYAFWRIGLQHYQGTGS
jgi:ABC-2 type transport system permease protein